MRLKPFEDILRNAVGLSAAALGEKALVRAVSDAMRRAGFADAEAYLAALRADPRLVDALACGAVVPETWFFRDRAPFACLAEHLRGFFRAGRKPRLLSAPCSTGEEAYSMAMAALSAGLAPDGFVVEAADVRQTSLETAERAVYGPNSMREDPGPYKRFLACGTNPETGKPQYAVAPEAAEAVHFVRANVVGPSFLADAAPFDVVFSRNLLIYLADDARKQLLANIDRLLAKDGLLFVGHSEIAYFLDNGFTSLGRSGAFACRRAAPAKPASRRRIPVARPCARSDVRPFARSDARPFARSDARPAASARPSPPATTGPRPGPRPQGRPAVASKAASSAANGDAPSPASEGLAAARRLADRGDLPKAMDLCQAYLRTNKADPEAFCLMGLVCCAEQQPDKARSHFLKALYLAPNHRQSLMHLALLYEQRGDAAKAAVYRRRLERAGAGEAET